MSTGTGTGTGSISWFDYFFGPSTSYVLSMNSLCESFDCRNQV